MKAGGSRGKMPVCPSLGNDQRKHQSTTRVVQPIQIG